MWMVTKLALALVVCLPCTVLAAPSNVWGSSFIDKGKFANGIKTFGRNSCETESETVFGGMTQ